MYMIFCSVKKTVSFFVFIWCFDGFWFQVRILNRLHTDIVITLFSSSTTVLILQWAKNSDSKLGWNCGVLVCSWPTESQMFYLSCSSKYLRASCLRCAGDGRLREKRWQRWQYLCSQIHHCLTLGSRKQSPRQGFRCTWFEGVCSGERREGGRAGGTGLK